MLKAKKKERNRANEKLKIFKNGSKDREREREKDGVENVILKQERMKERERVILVAKEEHARERLRLKKKL